MRSKLSDKIFLPIFGMFVGGSLGFALERHETKQLAAKQLASKFGTESTLVAKPWPAPSNRS